MVYRDDEVDNDGDGGETDAGYERELTRLLESGRKIQAVKLHRERFGGDLRDAKEAVERFAAERGIKPQFGGNTATLVFLIVLLIFVAAVIALIA